MSVFMCVSIFTHTHIKHGQCNSIMNADAGFNNAY